MKWSATQRKQLTYCISNNFGANKAAVVEAFRQATDLGWEIRGNVNFIYSSGQDGACTASNPASLNCCVKGARVGWMKA